MRVRPEAIAQDQVSVLAIRMSDEGWAKTKAETLYTPRFVGVWGPAIGYIHCMSSKFCLPLQQHDMQAKNK